MSEKFTAATAQFHRDEALKYEKEANTGVGDPAVSAQLAVMHATLAAAAVNIGIRGVCESIEAGQRAQLTDIAAAVSMSSHR